MSGLTWSQVRQWRAAPLEDSGRKLATTLNRLLSLDDELRAMRRTPGWEGEAAQAARGEQAAIGEPIEDLVTEVSAARRAILQAADATAEIEFAVESVEHYAAANSLEVTDVGVRDLLVLPCFVRAADAQVAKLERQRIVDDCMALVEAVRRKADDTNEDLNSALRPILAGSLANLTAGSLSEAEVDGSSYGASDADRELGFWLPHASNITWDPRQGWLENGVKIASSDEVGASVFGLSGELIARYGRGWSSLYPGPGAETGFVPRADAASTAVDQWKGTRLVWNADGTILVPEGTPGVDPRIPPMPGPDFKPRGFTSGVGFAEHPVNPPSWAEGTAKSLGAVGAVLTIGGAGYGQWQQDSTLNPGMSTTTHLERAATTAAIEGGSSAAVGWGGAWAGAEVGGAIGTAVCPGAGTVVGGVIGGVVGGFVGSKAGAALGHEGRHLWHEAFG
jgi:uncharacterized protein YukE